MTGKRPIFKNAIELNKGDILLIGGKWRVCQGLVEASRFSINVLFDATTSGNPFESFTGTLTVPNDFPILKKEQ